MPAKKTTATLVAATAWINIVLAILHLLAGLALIALGSLVISFLGHSLGDAADLGRLFFRIFGAVITIASVFWIVASIRLLAHKPWARTTILVFSVLNLLSFPIGTAAGVFGIWVLGMEKDVKKLFR